MPELRGSAPVRFCPDREAFRFARTPPAFGRSPGVGIGRVTRKQAGAQAGPPAQYSRRSAGGGGFHWYSQVSVSALPPLRRYRRTSIWVVESSGGTTSNIAR